MPHLALIEGLGFSNFITQVIKVILIMLISFLNSKTFCGRKRPNFFALCNYKGYKTALATGNFTYYNSVTVAGTNTFH